MNNKKRLVHIAILASIVCVLAVFSAPQNDAYAASKKPSNTSITRISKTNKSITVKLAKSKLAKGYQVKVSTTKKFTSAKTKTVSNSTYKNNGKMVSVRALKKKTKYYIKARAYNVKNNGKRIYSKWTKKCTCITKDAPVLSSPVKTLLNTARSWLGYSEYNDKFLYLIELYNMQDKVPVSYYLNSQDAWCAAFVSAVCIQSGLLDKTFTECSCWRMAKLYYKKGLWVGKKNYIPKAGDIIFYDWGGAGALKKPTATLDHVGIVESVDNKVVTVIEGNSNDSVKRRTILTSSSYIAGYATPDYENSK